MYAQQINSRRGKIKILLDDNYKPVKPVNNFLKSMLNRGKSPNTITAYCYHLKIFFEFLQAIGITYDDVFADESSEKGPMDYFSDFIIYLQFPQFFGGKIINFNRDQEVAPERTNATVNCIMAAVFSFYDYLARNETLKHLDVYKDIVANGQTWNFLYGMTTNNLVKSNVFKLREPDEELKYITEEQCIELMKACKTLRDKLIVGCGFYLGMRASEILNLRISDLHLWENIILVTPRENNINGARVKNYAKGKLRVPPKLALMFIKYLDQIADVDTDYVFINLKGKTKHEPMNLGNIEEFYKTLSERVGFKVTSHMCRHGYAVMRLSAGAQLIDIQKELRHKSMESTLIYAEFLDRAQLENARKYFETIANDFSFEDLSFYEKGGTLCQI